MTFSVQHTLDLPVHRCIQRVHTSGESTMRSHLLGRSLLMTILAGAMSLSLSAHAGAQQSGGIAPAFSASPANRQEITFGPTGLVTGITVQPTSALQYSVTPEQIREVGDVFQGTIVRVIDALGNLLRGSF